MIFFTASARSGAPLLPRVDEARGLLPRHLAKAALCVIGWPFSLIEQDLGMTASVSRCSTPGRPPRTLQLGRLVRGPAVRRTAGCKKGRPQLTAAIAYRRLAANPSRADQPGGSGRRTSGTPGTWAPTHTLCSVRSMSFSCIRAFSENLQYHTAIVEPAQQAGTRRVMRIESSRD